MLRWAVALVVSCVWFGRPPAAAACVCPAAASLCDDLARSNTAVIGTVRAIAPHTREVTVDVEEVFAGSPGKVLVISMQYVDLSCVYDRFQVGERMLLVGNMQTGFLHVLVCSHTAPVARAAAEIAELRRIAKRGTATISGVAVTEGGPPRPNVEVRLAGTDQVTRTDATGRFRFEVAPGRYTVVPAPDPSLVSYQGWPIEAIAGACRVADTHQRWNGRIRGTVRDRDGRPLAGVHVAARSLRARAPAPATNSLADLSVATDARGGYELAGLSPDTYRVSIGVPFYPREPYPPATAPDVVLGPGAIVERVDLAVSPPLPTHTITARVVLQGPRPTWNHLEIEASDAASGRRYSHVGNFGSFTFVDAAGGTRELRACFGAPRCVTRSVELDRDVTVELPFETHQLTIHAVVPKRAPPGTKWRVAVTIDGTLELNIRDRTDDVVLVDLAGHKAELRACLLDADQGDLERTCTTASTDFDRDRVVAMALPAKR